MEKAGLNMETVLARVKAKLKGAATSEERLKLQNFDIGLLKFRNDGGLDRRYKINKEFLRLLELCGENEYEYLSRVRAEKSAKARMINNQQEQNGTNPSNISFSTNSDNSGSNSFLSESQILFEQNIIKSSQSSTRGSLFDQMQ